MASQQYGGAEKVFVELSNLLSDQFDVTALVLRATEYIGRFSQNVRVLELKSHPTRHNPLLLFEIYSVLKRERPDLIHTHAVKATELVCLANRLLHIRHLGTKHNDRKGRIFNTMHWVSTVSEKAGASIFPSPGARIKIIQHGVREEQVIVREKPDIFTLVAVGRLDPIKGFDELLRQVALLDFDFRLMIAGDGPERESLQALIDALGLQEKAVLLGHREDIAQLMADCHLVVITSHREGGPLVAFEALHYAPMLLATRVGEICNLLPEILQVSHQNLAARLTDVATNYPAYEEIFQSLKQTKKENFSTKRWMEQYAAYYTEILSASA